MIRIAFAFAALGLGATAALAQQNPISERQQVMKTMSSASRDGAAMVRSETFDQAKAQAIFAIFRDAANKLPNLFPENSKTGETKASPRIWEDPAGFKGELAKLSASAEAGAKATDIASFKAAFENIGRECGVCHEAYRVRR